MEPVVVSIIAFNEESHIGAAIESARSVSQHIVVLDSYSTDSTAEQARRHGALVLQRTFDNFSTHRNWLLDEIQKRYGPNVWILTLDADERIGDDLVRDILKELQRPRHDGYLVRIEIHFDGRALKHGGVGKKYFMRLYRVDSGRYALGVHEQLVPRGSFSVGKLKGSLIHIDVLSWDRYIDKHNRYSTLEAIAIREKNARIASISLWSAVRNSALRRRWLRDSIWNRLPAKPLLRWIHIYLVMGGFLDGRAGFRRALFAAWQNMCIAAKYDELMRGTQEAYPSGLNFVSARRSGSERLVVCIPTFNEEAHIADAVRSGKQLTDQVIVVDSFSEDSTCDIAAQEGATVWEHAFESYAQQRNWAIERISEEFGDAWLFDVDADERISPELAVEVADTLFDRKPAHQVYVVKWRLYFDRTPLRFGGFANTKIARLYRSSAARYEMRAINEHLVIGRGVTVGTLKNRLIHTDVRSWERHISKHNKIATLEARARVEALASNDGVTLAKALRQPFLRRRWLRDKIWNRLPARPFWRFIQTAVVGGGFLDGRAGLRIALFNSWAEMCIDLKYEEMTKSSRPRVVPRSSAPDQPT